MDSINRNQPEHNREDVSGADAVERIQSLVKKKQTCFFCTAIPTGKSSGARPMSVQDIDDEGNLWFLSADDSHTNAEIELDPSVKLFFQGSAHSDFLQLDGTAYISRDRAKIRELFNFFEKTWFTEGEDDPRITVIKVVPSTGYYWDNKHGNMVAAVKILVGAAVGKTLDDSIEGKITV